MEDGKRKVGQSLEARAVGILSRSRKGGRSYICSCITQGGLRHTACAYYYLVRSRLGDPSPTGQPCPYRSGGGNGY